MPPSGAVRAFAADHAVDLWQAESTPYSEALSDLPEAARLIIAHNVESLIWQRYCEVEPHPVKRAYIGHQWRKYERFERHAFATATRVVAVSAEDARLVARFGGQHVDVVENGLDRPYFETVRPEGRDPRRILFLGSLSWRPNLDAVGLLLDQIFPAVRAEEPTARLYLVGRQPPESLVRRVHGLENVELHADVPDVRPYLAQCGLMVVPLRIGGGSRLKILEALATGLPVLSTSVGAEGLELTPGRDYTVAETAAETARALVQFLRNPAPFRAQAEHARQFVLDRYDWETLAAQLEQSWYACVETGRRAREACAP